MILAVRPLCWEEAPACAFQRVFLGALSRPEEGERRPSVPPSDVHHSLPLGHAGSAETYKFCDRAQGTHCLGVKPLEEPCWG